MFFIVFLPNDNDLGTPWEGKLLRNYHPHVSAKLEEACSSASVDVSQERHV